MTEKGLKYLSDILRAIDLIEEFISNISSYNDYEHDAKTQSAVERQLSIIGEAVNKFSLIHPDLTFEHSRKIIGFRNRLIHAYDAIDSTIIWVIIRRHLPQLKAEISSLTRS